MWGREKDFLNGGENIHLEFSNYHSAQFFSQACFGADHFIWCELNKACSVWLYVYIILKISDNFQKWKIFFGEKHAGHS